MFFAPNFLGDPDNYIPANPLVTPAHIVPEWYLLPFYAILRSIPQKLLGVLVMFGAHRDAVLPAVARHLQGALDALPPDAEAVLLDLRRSTACCSAMCGAQARRMRCGISAASTLSLVWPARLAALYYYAYFWSILPIVGLIETPKPVPESIAKPVLAKRRAE